MANGASGVYVESAADVAKFRDALVELAQVLAKAIARDGEGASKLIEVRLESAPELAMARKAARGITLSPLIKAAIHGEDPNWGRILARLGAEGIPAECLNMMDLFIQEIPIFKNGRPLEFERSAVRMQLKKETIVITVRLNSGAYNATAWGCDLSKKYVDINAEYST
jgi:glutamate N-acetyltransferase/amino-acid N-acetyltransferase